jgi:hypothetical protein
MEPTHEIFQSINPWDVWKYEEPDPQDLQDDEDLRDYAEEAYNSDPENFI